MRLGFLKLLTRVVFDLLARNNRCMTLKASFSRSPGPSMAVGFFLESFGLVDTSCCFLSAPCRLTMVQTGWKPSEPMNGLIMLLPPLFESRVYGFLQFIPYPAVSIDSHRKTGFKIPVLNN